ncbi:MAG: hypothetical protein ACQEQS_06095 [Thermodesulfobacteriota bacterium]
MAFNNFPEPSMNEKKQLLEKAAHENWIFFLNMILILMLAQLEKKITGFIYQNILNWKNKTELYFKNIKKAGIFLIPGFFYKFYNFY